MTVIVRDLHPGADADIEGFVRVRHAALPYVYFSRASVLHHLALTPAAAHYRALVAEEDGEVVGTAQVGLAHDSPEPGQGWLNVYVDPARARRGAGTLLVRAAEEHLAAHGATKLFAWVLDEPGHRAFAERHGYRASRSAHFLVLDLKHTELPPPQKPPAGVELRTAADFADDPRPLFTLDAETNSDEPGDIAIEFTDYEAWIAEYWKHPHLDRELTSVAVADGRPVAFSVAHTDGAARYGTGMTGTVRDHRGRGLAKLVKNDSLHRARAAGYTQAHTSNDSDNGPMLAVNRWFGYEIRATEVRYVRELG
ncbi:GNAT superfamily N-acetyltransferase [Streptomyces achromogenes]|uniref:GNAT family N-acetyltransferase n=1 Tax=Streptomyces achromogenes TaxID=67255 RepID=UPI00278248CF|nr:GNAT family N-acetyltransferase [Streptomyces achromogenes]MDQ0830021.1 GNAT superfamily N-acetyltransferase [Streptomyces achromogenes]